MDVVELHIENHVDLLTELTLELLPSLVVLRVSFFLISPDVYDPLQIFLQKANSEEINALFCWSVFSGVELTCHAARILLELPLTTTCLSRCDALVLLP